MKTRTALLTLALAAALPLHAQITIDYGIDETNDTDYSTSPPFNPTTLNVPIGPATQSGSLTGTGDVVKIGAGTLILSGASDYTGLTAVNGGALTVTGSLTTGGLGVGRAADSTGAVTVSGEGALLRIEDGSPSFVTVGDAAGSTGTLTVENGGLVSLALDAKLTVGWQNATGTLNLNAGGTVEVGGVNGIQNHLTGTTHFNLAGGTLRVINTDLTAGVPLTLVASTNSTINTNGFNATLSDSLTGANALTGSGALTKAGAGTLLLNGANTWTGGTTVNGGTLRAGVANAFPASTAWTVNAGTLDLNDQFLLASSLSGMGGTVALGTALLNLTQSVDTTYAGAITGTGTFSKNGTGTLTLSGVSDHAGNTSVNAGTLAITGQITTAGLGIARQTGSTGVVTVSGAGAVLRVEDGAPSFVTVGDGASSNGTLTIENGGLVSLASGAKLTVGWENATGTLNLNAGGTVEVGGTDGIQKSPTATASHINLAGGTIKVVNSALTTSVPMTLAESTTSTLDTNGLNAEISGVLSGPGALAKTGNGTLTLTGPNTYAGGTTVTAGTLRGSTTSLQGDIVNNATVVFNQPDTGTYAGAISGSGAFRKTGDGALILTGANTYTGGTVVEGGTLQINATGALASTGALTISAGTFTLFNKTQTVGALSGSGGNLLLLGSGAITTDSGANTTLVTSIIGNGGLTKAGSGTLTLTGENSYEGGTTLKGGVLSVSSNANLGGTNGTLTFDSGTLRITGIGFSMNREITLQAGGGTFDVVTGSVFPTSFSTGPGTLTKTGPGVLIIAPNGSHYPGKTTISQGTLTLIAAVSQTVEIEIAAAAVFDVSTMPYTLGASQTLSGSGTVLGDITIAGTLAPGASAGLLTFDDDLTLDSAAHITLELGGTAPSEYDRIAVGGALTYGGTLTLDFINGFEPEVGYTFLLFDAGGSHDGEFDDIVFTTPGYAGTFHYDTGSLQITAVPEPSAWALLGLAFLGLALLRRKPTTDQ